MWFVEYTNAGTGPFEQRGTVELNLEHVAVRKSWGRVLLGMLGVAGMIAIWMAATVPWLPIPGWQSAPLMLLVFFLYAMLAHYVHPRPNTDNMGWIGGLANDPFQYNDNINRMLFSLRCHLGPGRFAASATIDLLVACGLLPERTEEDIQFERAVRAETEYEDRAEKILARVEERAAQREHQGQVTLSSARYLQPEQGEHDQTD